MGYILPTSNSQLFWDSRARAVAAQYGLDGDFFSTLIGSESAWKTNNPSGTGPYGLGQFTSATAKEWGVIKGNPESELDGAARYLKFLIKKTGSLQGAVYAYKGHDYDQKHAIAAESSWAKIVATMSHLKGVAGDTLGLLASGGAGQTDAQNPQAAQGAQAQGGGILAVDWGKWITFLIIAALLIFGIQQIVKG